MSKLEHKENTAVWLCWPCFHTPLHNIPPPVSSVGSHHALLDPATALNAFLSNFANIGARNSIQLSNRCVMCWKKPFLQSLSTSEKILSKFCIRDTPEYHPSVREQWGLSGLISAIRLGLPRGQGWGNFFVCGQPPQLNSVDNGTVLPMKNNDFHYTGA